MNILKNKKRNLPGQMGFSIIELMISIPLGLLILAAVLKIFTASMAGVNLQNGFSRVQENGRLATELMVRDIRGADYWGCAGDIDEITNNLLVTDLSYNDLLLPTAGLAIDGVNNASTTTIGTVAVEDGTDILTLRGAYSQSGVKISGAMSTTTAEIVINTGSTLAQGDTLLISDCTETDLFSNTTNDTPTSGRIGHTTSILASAIDNASATFSRAYGASAQILIPYTKTYFIGNSTATTLSLYRVDDGTVNELVRGVNDLQLMYGVDSSGNGSADTYTETPGDMNQVLSIRISLTAESGESSSGTPVNRTYQTTANIRNRTLQ